jgi:hypothetical protein
VRLAADERRISIDEGRRVQLVIPAEARMTEFCSG